jgi:phage tail sheath protein FI
MTEYLAPDVYILEEKPSVPAIAGVPTSVLGVVGVTERGPIAVSTLVTSWEEFVKAFGGYTAEADATLAAYGFFKNGGQYLWVVRTVHFTDPTNPASHTAVRGDLMIKTRAGGATPAAVRSSLAAPFLFDGFDDLQITTDLGGPTTVNWAAGPAVITGSPIPDPVVPGTDTLVVKVNREATPQVITFAGTEVTMADVIAAINAQIVGAQAEGLPFGGSTMIQLRSDRRGTSAYIEVVSIPATAPLIGLTTGEVQGTGDVADSSNVLAAEIKTQVEAAIADVAVTANGDGTVTIATRATGSSKSIQVVGGSAQAKIGLDGDPHVGTTDAPQNTLKVEGKTEGAYANSLSIVTARATSDTSVGATAPEFNLTVYDSGVIAEVFPNVTMDATSAAYVETVINHASLGSNLIRVTDQGIVGTPAQKKPDIGVAAPFRKDWSVMANGNDGLTGLTDTDFLGSDVGPTGLFALDTVADLSLLAVPGRASPAIHTGMLDYCETWRKGQAFAVLDCPPASVCPTEPDIIAYVETTAGILEYSEYGAMYWPRIKVVNPDKAVFGADDYIAVDNSGWVAGAYARNDQREGGIHTSPAGVENGIVQGCVGFEIDRLKDPKKVALIYPKRINPILQLSGTPRHIDGGRTLKSTGNWPHVCQRRSVSYIEQSIKRGLVWAKHINNTETLRARANRAVTAFMIREMNQDAFVSRVPAEAFYVDTSAKLNPPAEAYAGRLHIRVGIAKATPSEFVIVHITADTRAFEESLAG